MLLKNCIYLIILVISLISVPMLIYSNKSNNSRNCKAVKIINYFYIAYLILNVAIMPNILSLNTGLEFLFLALIAAIAVIIYIISIIICSKKIKKDHKTITFSKKVLLVILPLIILPFLLFAYSFINEYYLIIHSDLILVYKSSGNGGLSDSHRFAYVINEDYCKEISLGIAAGAYSLERYIPDNVKKIDNAENINNYNIILADNEKNITIYKDNKLIHKKQINEKYFNITFDGGFYLKNN